MKSTLMYFVWLVVFLSISSHVEASVDQLGYVILLGDRNPLIYCLSEVVPNTSQIFPSIWTPLDGSNTSMGDASATSCNFLLFERVATTNEINSEFNNLALIANEPGYIECLKQFAQTHGRSVLGSLPVMKFRQLSTATTAENHSIMNLRLERDTINPDSSITRSPLLFLFVYACAFSSIALGCIMILVSWDKLLQQMRERSIPTKWSKLSGLFLITLLVILASVSLLIYYYLFDYAVYIAITLYCIAGTVTITSTVAFWIMYFIAPTRKRIPVNLSVCNRSTEFTLSVTELCVLPAAICIMITWLVFRNDPNIGWPMQSVIGAIMIARILSSAVTFPSVKLITAAFTVFLLFDVFFVFITPLIMHQKVDSTPPSLPAQAPLERRARSTSSASSVMEAVALGSAGKSGESVPLSFRFQLSMTTGTYQCSTISSATLLGFGDAVFPGFLCAFVAFFDSVWQIRLRRNVIASLCGYAIGIAFTQVALTFTHTAQPALLYLCPCTLLITVASCGLFGGVEELKRMWNGSIPASFDNDWVDYCAHPTTEGMADAKGEGPDVEHHDLEHSQISLVRCA